jgi:hypothetical protein
MLSIETSFQNSGSGLCGPLTSARDFILVGLFLASRRSSIGSLTWENVDAQARSYIIPKDAEGNKAKKAINFPNARGNRIGSAYGKTIDT